MLLRWIIGLVVPAAYAALPAQDPCVGVPGGCLPQNVLLNVPTILGPILVGLAAGGAVLMVVIGGAQMLLSLGDESKASKGKMTVIYSLVGFGVALASQALVTFIHTRAAPLATADIPTLDLMAAIIATMLSVFNISFVLVVIYAAFRLVLAWGKQDEHGKAWSMILWAVFGAIVINVAHALVRTVLRFGL